MKLMFIDGKNGNEQIMVTTYFGMINELISMTEINIKYECLVDVTEYNI